MYAKQYEDPKLTTDRNRKLLDMLKASEVQDEKDGMDMIDKVLVKSHEDSDFSDSQYSMDTITDKDKKEEEESEKNNSAHQSQDNGGDEILSEADVE